MADRKRVLFVDDDPFLLRSIARLLGDTYEITLLDDSRQVEAIIERASTAGRPFVAIVSDADMPGRTGFEVLADVARLFPCLGRVLYSGGFKGITDEQIHAAIPQGTSFVAKPFTREELVAAIETAIDRVVASASGTSG